MTPYDLIAIGTGSAMTVVQAYLEEHPGSRVAVIDKDPPGGICLTKGCVPTKLLVYPAELVRLTAAAPAFGIPIHSGPPDFPAIMARMRDAVSADVESIRQGLTQADGIDYIADTARFIAPRTVRAGGVDMHAPCVLLCTGSRPAIPAISGLDRTPFHTSDSILQIDRLPRRMVIVGGGYIAVEYAHFFSAMGAEVTIIGRNPRILPGEEPEISALALKEMSRYLDAMVNHEVVAVSSGAGGEIAVEAVDRENGRTMRRNTDLLLVATGRAPNTDLLDSRQGGIETDADGWIRTNDYLETTSPNVWALGDATGHHLFKHVANYEAKVVYYNAVRKEKVPVNYHAVPHAVFGWPEVASVGLGEAEAEAAVGEDNVLIGFHRFRDTTRGEAMQAGDEFAKIVVDRSTQRILGAHVIGHQASILIQEVVTLMYTPERSVLPIYQGMHIHPSLSEVIERAVLSLMPLRAYREHIHA